MRIAIETKFAGPTNCRGARVIAASETNRMTVSWDYALDAPANHAAAARALAAKFGWDGQWFAAASVSGKGYVFVRDLGRECLSTRAFSVFLALCEDVVLKESGISPRRSKCSWLDTRTRG